MTIRIYSTNCAKQANVITLYFYTMDMTDVIQKNLQLNMDTNVETTTNEATRKSRGISEIRDINVIKPIP